MRLRVANKKDEGKLRRIRRVEKAVSRASRMNLIYRLGGGRAGGGTFFPRTSGEAWGDCSAWACLLCAIAGLKLDNPDGWTGTLQDEGKAGKSEYLTLFIKEPMNVDGHVIIRLRKRPRPWHFGIPVYRWTECGGRDNPKSGGGPTWFRPTKSRIEEFPIQRHFEAL